MLPGGHEELNPNTTWLKSKGLWFSYIVGVLALHFLLLCIPIFSVATAWTLTNVIHNMAMFVFLHLMKGVPWESSDQGKNRELTHWEQIDYGKQLTSTRKFFTIIPIIL